MMDGVFIWRVARYKGQGMGDGQRNAGKGATPGQLAGTETRRNPLQPVFGHYRTGSKTYVFD